MNIPTWLFFGILGDKKVWTEDMELTAQKILGKIIQKAKFEHWPPEVLETVLKVNEHDDCNMYGISEIKKIKL
jgi:hypothetical protein